MKLTFDLLREQTVGRNTLFETPYGERRLTYADYTASGRALAFVETYMGEIQKYYANTHTEDDMTGAVMTNLLHKAERTIKEKLNGLDNCYVIPSGTGATGAIESFAKIAGIYISPGTRKRVDRIMEKASGKGIEAVLSEKDEAVLAEIPVVFITPYEHHSNILMWREGLAELVQIGLNEEGMLDLDELKEKVADPKYKNRVKIGSLSAASNVTGVRTPVYEAARILHENGALACFDFAASGPYVKIDMNHSETSYFDAVYFSPHKFIGGPGAAGILVVNKAVYDKALPPTVSGGGTVSYVSSFAHDYVDSVEEREKAGTPGILQVIRAALAIELKDAVGIDAIEEKEAYYTAKVLNRFANNPAIEILGPKDADKRISIVSIMIRYKDKYLHPRYLAKLINDLFGIQTRAGCACAGPYGHMLLGIGNARSERFRKFIADGYSSLKPGWLRFNLHYTMSEAEVDFLCDAIEFVGAYGGLFLDDYLMDEKSGDWCHKSFKGNSQMVENFGIMESVNFADKERVKLEASNAEEDYADYLDKAHKMADILSESDNGRFAELEQDSQEKERWFYFKHVMNKVG